jgi:hypothetical protein
VPSPRQGLDVRIVLSTMTGWARDGILLRACPLDEELGDDIIQPDRTFRSSARSEVVMSQPTRRVLRHVVLFAFKETATSARIQAIEQAFAALPSQIAEIKGFEWGTDVSVEHLADGYTHCFLVTFTSLPDRDAYLVHPAHRAFVAGLQAHLAKALVIDYWSGRDQAASR